MDYAWRLLEAIKTLVYCIQGWANNTPRKQSHAGRTPQVSRPEMLPVYLCGQAASPTKKISYSIAIVGQPLEHIKSTLKKTLCRPESHLKRTIFFSPFYT